MQTLPAAFQRVFFLYAGVYIILSLHCAIASGSWSQFSLPFCEVRRGLGAFGFQQDKALISGFCALFRVPSFQKDDRGGRQIQSSGLSGRHVREQTPLRCSCICLETSIREPKTQGHRPMKMAQRSVPRPAGAWKASRPVVGSSTSSARLRAPGSSPNISGSGARFASQI